MIPEAYISHSTAERVRLKIPSKKRDDLYFGSLMDAFRANEKILSIEANPLTGSILIEHQLDLHDLTAFAKEKGLFIVKESEEKALSGETALHKTISQGYSSLDRKVRKATGGATDIGDLAFMALVASGVYEISKGNFIAPAWYTALWYGLGIFFKGKGDKGENASG
jgi:hypothetical protein